MSKSPRNSATQVTKAVAQFSVEAWRAKLDTAALSFTTAGKAMLDLMLEARGKVEADTVREALQHAFAGAYAATYGHTFEEACKAKSVMNRVSDGMAVFKAENLPGTLPGNLQQAAAACRKENPSGKTRKPRQPVAAQVDAKDVNPLALLNAALEALRQECGDNDIALSLVGDLCDLASELGEALELIPGEVSKAA